jgi:hypothetical protein
MIPTLFGIMLINFIVVQAAPGGPVEQAIAQLTGQGSSITERVTRAGTGETLASTAPASDSTSRYRGAQGLDPEFIKELEQRFGFDKPMHERFFKMMGDYLTFDFGESFFRDRKVVDLVLDKMPVSISLGVWTTLIVYLVSIPLGIAKAVRDGNRFDVGTSFALVIGTAIPSFLFAVFLLVVFAGGSYLDWFPHWLHRQCRVYRGLFLAHCVAGSGNGHRRLCRTCNADQELFPRSTASAIRTDRARQGPFGAACALWARIPQCHADCHRRFSRCIREHSVHRFGTDRDHLLSGRTWAARIRGRIQPRLPVDVRHIVLFLFARAADEPDR